MTISGISNSFTKLELKYDEKQKPRWINTCHLKDNGIIVISCNELVPSTYNRCGKSIRYAIKPNGTVIDEVGGGLYRTDDKVKELIAKLKTNLKNNNKITTNILASEIRKSLEFVPQYYIRTQKATIWAPKKLANGKWESRPEETMTISHFYDGNYTDTYSIDYDFYGDMVGFRFERRNCDGRKSYTSKSDKIPENAKETFRRIFDSYKKQELKYEDMDNFIQNTLIPLQEITK